ncbi:hypothetical protein [Myxococcus sp. Y35]|uniref:hypothetical protein n=1 Tax=Pseudomyxococcus flavus TaxID=3115648 RepID=UPI003CF7B00F
MHRVFPFVVSMGLSLAPLAARAQAEGVARPAAARPASIQFKRSNARVGSAREVDSAVNMRLALDLRSDDIPEPLSVEMLVTTTSRHTVTTVAARGNVINKVKMAFGDVSEVSQEKGETQRKVSPISGKTYLAELKKGQLVITDAAGNPASKAELQEVQEHLPELGKPDLMEATFAGKSFVVGSTVDGFSGLLGQQMVGDQGDDTQVTHTRAQLVEVRQAPEGTVGVFDVSMTMSRREADAPFLMTIPLKGQMSVLANGIQLLELTLSGPVQLTLTEDEAAQGIQGKGEGEMRLRLSNRRVDSKG